MIASREGGKGDVEPSNSMRMNSIHGIQLKLCRSAFSFPALRLCVFYLNRKAAVPAFLMKRNILAVVVCQKLSIYSGNRRLSKEW